MHKLVKVDAPAKINLSFDITGRREDGYHLVDTLMQTISLYDTVTISRISGQGIFISCDREGIPCDEENIAHIAAKKFFKAFHTQEIAIAIDIQKRIPDQAGLGGGSADAAAVLVGLNALLDTGASMEQLCEIGARVGADVPFCLLGGTRRVQGIGERMAELPAMGECVLLIAKPRAGISTKLSYQRYDRQGCERHPDTAYLLRRLEDGNLRGLASGMYNVLEEVAGLADIPILRDKMQENGALGSLMSGSGSAVFGVFDNRRLAKRCMRKLYDHAGSIFLTRPVPQGALVFETKEP